MKDKKKERKWETKREKEKRKDDRETDRENYVFYEERNREEWKKKNFILYFLKAKKIKFF